MTEVRISPNAGDDSGTAEVRVGDVLAVDVPENRTTGFVWSVAVLPDMLAELPAELPADAVVGGDDPLLPGATARRILRFAAQQPGVGELRLRHARPWEREGGDEVTVTVRVDPPG